MEEAIDFCNLVGTLTVMKKGVQASLPTLEEVNDYKDRIHTENVSTMVYIL